jgi:hypothetical protein
MMIRPWRLAAGLFLSLPLVLGAQEPAAAPATPERATMSRPVISPNLFPSPDLGPAPAAQTGLACPECHPQKQFWPAFGELMIAQMLPFSLNHFVRDREWADVSPTSWLRNLENPWVWDNNQFLNNQFSHPYHGSLYFNSGRANGFNFWTSSLFAMGGSFMWEEFFEVWAPAPNDWLNTSLGGITIGETFYHLSSLILDNTATGSERTWREIGAFLVDPMRGFSRLVGGKTHGVTANPEDWRPSKIQGNVDIGARNLQGFEGSSISGASAMIWVWYDDPVTSVVKKPFTTIRFNAELASNNKDEVTGKGSGLNGLNIRGNLGGRQLGSGGQSQNYLGTFLRYEYFNSSAYEFGGQGFNAGLVSRFGGREPGDFHLDLEVLGDFMPIAAVRSDYYATEEGRDYDYGVGLGGWTEARALWPGKGMLRVQGRYLWQPTLSGFNGYHTQAALTGEGRYYLGGRFGVGGTVTYYNTRGIYDDFADVTKTGTQYRLFASLAFPKWESR